jgi:predicted exporter
MVDAGDHRRGVCTGHDVHGSDARRGPEFFLSTNDPGIQQTIKNERGIVYSGVIIAAGFAIFVLSNFPPTQRFGLLVLAGCIINIVANLFVLPLLGGAPLKKRI